MTSKYEIERTTEGVKVWAYEVAKEDDDGVGYHIRPITPEDSLKLRKHSPDGFEFGYGGSGPSQLALAILLDVGREAKAASPEDLALDNYQDFKMHFIATQGYRGEGEKIESFEIDMRDILQWLGHRSGVGGAE